MRSSFSWLEQKLAFSASAFLLAFEVTERDECSADFFFWCFERTLPPIPFYF